MAPQEGIPENASGSSHGKKRPGAGLPGPNANGGEAIAPKAAAQTRPAEASGNTQRKPPESKTGAATSSAKATSVPSSEDLVVVTLKASTGSIVKLEGVAADGSRHELSARESAQLAGERPTLSSLVHDAFEAGIACILDEGIGADVAETSPEDREDAELRNALLDALIEKSEAKRLLSRETMNSAVLGTIILAASVEAKTAAPRSA